MGCQYNVYFKVENIQSLKYDAEKLKIPRNFFYNRFLEKKIVIAMPFSLDE